MGDLVALLHPPYTLWHLSYVAIGAALAVSVDWLRLAGTILAFFCGLGIAAHALDELKGRPLSTSFSDRTLRLLGIGGFVAAAAVAAVGVFVISPWVLAWAALGIALAAGYALEWPSWLHTDLGFGVAWGGFPVIVGYWAQEEGLSGAAIVVAAAAVLLSLAQRALSTPARFVRRRTDTATATFDDSRWGGAKLLSTWERPLRYLTWTAVALAAGLLLSHV